MATPRRIIGPVLGDDEDDTHSNNATTSEGPKPPPSSEGPAAPPRRRVIGPVLDDDEPDSNRSDEKEEAPAYEGPARPPTSSTSEATRRESRGDGRGDGREVELTRQVKRGREGASNMTSNMNSMAPIGPPRPGAIVSQPDSDDEDDRDKRLRAEEWSTVKRPQVSKTVHREEWMTELPPERGSNPVALITNRQFSRKDNVTRRGDTSMWTDTPQDRENKRLKGPAPSMKEIADQEFENQKETANKKFIEEYNKKYRAKSLAEVHQEEYKKKQAEIKDEDKPLWKPFDRTVDLEQRVADPKTAAKMIKNSHELNSRFGASSKRFL